MQFSPGMQDDRFQGHPRFLQSLHTEFSTTSPDILRYEFSVYASLNFKLHLTQPEYLPHLHRIVEESIVEAVSIEDYVGTACMDMEAEFDGARHLWEGGTGGGRG